MHYIEHPQEPLGYAQNKKKTQEKSWPTAWGRWCSYLRSDRVKQNYSIPSLFYLLYQEEQSASLKGEQKHGQEEIKVWDMRR